ETRGHSRHAPREPQPHSTNAPDRLPSSVGSASSAFSTVTVNEPLLARKVGELLPTSTPVLGGGGGTVVEPSARSRPPSSRERRGTPGGGCPRPPRRARSDRDRRRLDDAQPDQPAGSMLPDFPPSARAIVKPWSSRGGSRPRVRVQPGARAGAATPGVAPAMHAGTRGTRGPCRRRC